MATKLMQCGAKRVRLLLLAVACSLGMVAAPGAVADSGWQLEKEKDGISVFTREMPGSPFLAVKVATVIPTPVEKLAEFLGDGSECMQWRKMCKSSRVLQVSSEQERLVYQVLDLPWPIADRDMVIQSVTAIDPETRTVTVNIETRSDQFPQEKYTRAETSSQIRLRETGPESAEFSYIIHVDLGGNLSPGLINPQLVSSTLEDVERLIAMATQ